MHTRVLLIKIVFTMIPTFVAIFRPHLTYGYYYFNTPELISDEGLMI